MKNEIHTGWLVALGAGIALLLHGVELPLQQISSQPSESTVTGSLVIGSGITGESIGLSHELKLIALGDASKWKVQLGTNVLSGLSVKWETLTNTISEDNGFRWVPGGGPPIDWNNNRNGGTIIIPSVAYMQKVPAPATERWTIEIVTRRATISGKLDGREWSTISDTQIWAATNRMRLKQEWEVMK